MWKGVDLGIAPRQLGTVLVALEDGLRLHRLIDPDSTPADAFLDILELLQRLMTKPSLAPPSDRTSRKARAQAPIG